MRKTLVAANWKMHGSKAFAEQLLAELNSGLKSGECSTQVVICPPYPYLGVVGEAIGKAMLGAQNLSEQPSGAYTGEVSAEMLLDCGVRYAIVGHSERRSLYGECNELVAAKYAAAKAAGLIPILCVGESLEEREAGKTLEVVAEQIQAVIALGLPNTWQGAVVAYEPVWAIGTGKTATPEQAQEVHQFIRQQLGEAGAETQILYGGSVKAANAAELFAKADIDGALVGGASLKADEFIKICCAAN
ncbi:triose-phosphate isomerase [Microbulbifer hydrolyticus]|uniref:Triosephosphate isomerase n=1 Tax=Microbulbifer hydrolyticus TaxID=48074 RepID=A0A6P1TEG8_9GAMM|nr:triose-phosphate isomerase [Microbulbifer hydrolyticus]MBB5212397.1 triosephosphate isomerase [Microbulbifer hydrolyticus]QHQ40033.1 triose-phosphate isomerase [Microbulbifer hydrolyticus]